MPSVQRRKREARRLRHLNNKEKNMNKIRDKKPPKGCAEQMANLTADHPGASYYGNFQASYYGSIPTMIQHEAARLEKESYICSQCGMNLSSYPKFMKHEEKHNKEQTFKCSECDKRYNNLTGLRMHQEIHMMKKLYTCTDCDKSFVYRAHLIEHQKNHAGADTGSVNEALMYTAQNVDTIQWSMEEKREIMYCHYYAYELQPDGYIQLLRSKLERRGIVPLLKLQLASDSKLRTVVYDVKRRQYINDAELELIENAAKGEIAGKI